MARGKRTVFRRVGGEFMKNHCQWLCGFWDKRDVDAFDERVAFIRPRCEFVVNQFGQTNALPTRAAQESMCIRKRAETSVEALEEFIHRLAAFPCALRDNPDARENILHAMVELRDQEVFVVLG